MSRLIVKEKNFGYQGCNSTKIVGGARFRKNVGPHGWPKEKILGFEWPKTVQMALKF